MMNWRTLAVLTLFYVPVFTAQTAPNWTQQSLQGNPPGHDGGSMAYDSAHSQVVWLGAAVGDTWVWDGSNWTKKSPQTSPQYGDGPMAYDSIHSQVVMYDGAGTWVWDGTNWTQLSPQTSPPPRFNDALAFDSAHGQIVLFGGEDGNYNALGDTWVWDGSNWTQKSPQTSPPMRAGHVMVYDSVHGQVVLFGGQQAQGTLAGQPVNDTWVWDGSNWTQERPQTSPSARYGASMAYDPVHDQSVLFGGAQSGIFFFADTWTWYDGPPPATLPATVPSISGVVSASSFGGFSSVAPGSWVEIYGSNLAPDTRGWAGSDFTGNNAPTSLDGVSVSIGGQAAFVDYISAAQVNAQLPSNIATGGMLQLTVTNANGTSAPVNIMVNATEPGLLAPASFLIGANQYVVAQHSDGTYVLPVAAISGVTSSPAQPGETIIIYGVGFGSVTPDIAAGEIATETNQLSASFEILFGKTSAHLPYLGLAPSFVGLYQFNVTVPAVADSDLVPLTFNLGGVAGTQTLFTAVQE